MNRFHFLAALCALAFGAIGIRQSLRPSSSSPSPALRAATQKPRNPAPEASATASPSPSSILSPSPLTAAPGAAGMERNSARGKTGEGTKKNRDTPDGGGATRPLPEASTASLAAAVPDGEAMVLDVAPGTRLPIVLLGLNPELPGPVRQAGERLAVQFGSDLNGSPAADRIQDAGIPQGQWENARSRADEVFRALYGLEAFNQAGVEAALDALAVR